MDDENPCVGICIIGEDGYCEGCGRSEDEIYGVSPTPAPTPTKNEADGQAD
ncbi:hypothetical protein TSH58p_13955 [Azospirillum sp. TSH58]|uniref:DUF1289 domain-containing protein n=1 Tax=Azospirillum sp. TSH58 TaxID=664962 RepID=UPI000D601AEC|nr:DUF1289 domain-containing protein [Azospirillum sp. TSH58]AWJ84533.1 hypothetical protein TSH58p_13955 [Azospirillum sp. TSH58]